MEPQQMQMQSPCHDLDWKSGFLDGIIQWIREFGNWADLVIVFIFLLGLVLFLIYFPLTRGALGFLVSIIQSAWDATKRMAK